MLKLFIKLFRLSTLLITIASSLAWIAACACSSCRARLTKFKTVNKREKPGPGEHQESGARNESSHEMPGNFTLLAGNWDVIISQSSETITSHRHHPALGVSTQLIATEPPSLGHSGNIPSDLVQIGRGHTRTILLTSVFFLLCFSFYSFTKPFSLTQKRGQL